MRTVILDERLQSVREGAPGELCLSGPGLARRYWNQPELTARTFIPDFFCADARARLYRTADIVRRRLPDGQFAYCGRVDDQINLRGFRVEPAEIESALNACREVGDSVVIVREDVPGDRQGKVDRAALPEPRFDSKTAARRPVETRLERIVSSLLMTRVIDADTDFLQMDVHSLLAG
jgi:acyl-coenzyme A synthetase/AMP-(fatty) acid ligase